MSFDEDGGAGFASGPFSEPVNSVLGESFGSSLDGIDVIRGDDHTNRALGAKAHTIGSTISLGGDIREDVNDPSSMEVIAHEVAHALAGGGSGSKLLDGGRDDAGESAAHAASGAFRDFIAGGASGPAPRLSPAHGGTAMIHRFEAGEHADAVDHASDTLAAAGRDVDPAVAAAMAQPITLSNGVTVTQGQITAMMGDFYGAYTQGEDGAEHFDPAASFAAMDNADPEEMQRILGFVQQEQDGVTAARAGGPDFEPTDATTLERLTLGRHQHTDENGTTTGYSLLELAERNTNHFNTADESGTDNNMGAYGAFHEMAMQAAEQVATLPPGPERDAAQQRALALEASSMHFMTDRFAGGHQFDKQQLMDENGNGKIANARAHIVHNELNENGATVHNAAGEEWTALGDGHWAEEGNAENRVHTAEAVSASYGDINAIMNGDASAADFASPTATAHQSVPEWDPELNDRTMARAADQGPLDIIAAESDNISILPTVADRAIRNNVIHPIEDAASAAWDWTTDTASSVGHAVADGASRAWDATTGAASAAWDWTTDTASSVG
ncbi:MAG: DUF4157 domain-containing protein, partial [Myxococcales bacterium]|nr:DUF4157 domain-containing protein [Myxococcales bacterium]